MTNSSQTVTGTLTQDGFGNTVATTGSSANPYMYAATSGYRNDGDAGLMHVGARYYDAQVGRFTSRDTFLDQKPYLYCEHDPVNAVDPSGHLSDELVKSVAGKLGRFSVIALVAGFVENETPKGSWIHKIAGTVGVVGAFTTGLALIATGTPEVGTPFAPIGVGQIGLGVGIIGYAIKHAHDLWSE